MPTALLVQTLFDPAQRRAAMPVDQDAVEVDRKEVDALTRWIESMDEPIRWQGLRDLCLPRSGYTPKPRVSGGDAAPPWEDRRLSPIAR